jgi:hypothetical protein
MTKPGTSVGILATVFCVSAGAQTIDIMALSQAGAQTERTPLLKRILARLIGFDGADHRSTGKITIEKFERDVRVERFGDRAIWELMYFGKTPDLGD